MDCAFNDIDEGDIWGVLDDLRAGTGQPAEEQPGAGAPLPACAGTADRNAYGRKKRGGIGFGARKTLEVVQTKCENCDGIHVQLEEGAFVCRDCNYMQARVIDGGAEWRFYGADDNRGEDPTRCGMPTNNLLPHSSLGSMVGGRWNDNRDNRRIRQFNMWNSMPYWERTLYSVFEKLSSNASTHGITGKILDDAKIFYKTASEMKISRGDNKDGLVASCLYYACLVNKCERSTKEIAHIFNIESSVLTKGNSRFQEYMHINVPASGPDDFIRRFGTRLNMHYDDVCKCKAITQRIDELEIISENALTSAAAGVLYFYVMLNDLDITKKQIAEVCEVSEVTITKCYKRLLKLKDVIMGVLPAVPTARAH